MRIRRRLIFIGSIVDGGSYPKAMNDAGQVIGSSATAGGPSHGFFWEKGKIVDLGTLGGVRSYPRQINAAGQVVGVAETGQADATGHPILHAFLWVNGTITDLNSLLPDNAAATYTAFESINDFGQIVVSRAGTGVQEAYLLTPSP